MIHRDEKVILIGGQNEQKETVNTVNICRFFCVKQPFEHIVFPGKEHRFKYPDC